MEGRIKQICYGKAQKFYSSGHRGVGVSLPRNFGVAVTPTPCGRLDFTYCDNGKFLSYANDRGLVQPDTKPNL